MDNIVDLIRNAPVEQQPPTPTEKAQIVIFYTSPQQPTIVRYNTTKKAEKELDKLKSKWRKRDSADPIHDVDGDMFICTVDLTQVACVCYVDHAKRAKFVPIP